MASEPLQAQASRWLLENGPGQLEALFRAIVYPPSALVPQAANAIDLQSEVHADSAAAPVTSPRWQTAAGPEPQEGTVRLGGPDGRLFEVEYTSGGNMLPVRRLLPSGEAAAGEPDPAGGDNGEGREEAYAPLLLDTTGRIAGWYSGAAHMYGYTPDEVLNERADVLYPVEDHAGTEAQQELDRSLAEGHFGHECWSIRKDGSRFWANVITMTLRDERGDVQGFARIVRDFSERHDIDEKLRRNRARVGPVPARSTIAGIVSGEFDRVPEANDAFLKMVGYSREDLVGGTLHWPDLTPPEYSALDDLAHEEGLRFGACTPYEKELLRSDGTRVPVLVATAVLKLSPFRWITFIQDLRGRDEMEQVFEENVEPKQNFAEMVGSSAALKRVMRQVEVVAPTDANVLILGETGTGKELVARAVHRLSPRKSFPFVTLNCAAIPTGLLESELFGYEKGAFTGALQQKIGRFEMAHRGTLFLDEVGDIPLDLQPKLLRALQEKSFERLGGTRTIPIDVRLVAATNRNLTQMMSDKLFRSDLYYRLKVFPIVTPPLRDHPEDIPALARHFTQKYARAMRKQIEKIPSETMRALVSWCWPGNVRELENFIERAVILSRGPNLRAPLAEIRRDASDAGGSSTLAQVERDHVLRVLRDTGGVVSKAAARLGMPRTTLNALMRKLGISRRDL